MERDVGYVAHPCRGCEAGYHSCELVCRLLERWNRKHLGDVGDENVS
jgi:hypothetical protein